MQLMRSLGILAFAAQALAAQVAASAPARATESRADIGIVLAVRGWPTLAAGSGGSIPLAVLGALHDGDRLSLAAQDDVRFCDERAGTLVEIAGPGTVTLTAAGPVRSGGTPLMTAARRCEASAAADTDGGVLLRALSPKPSR